MELSTIMVIIKDDNYSELVLTEIKHWGQNTTALIIVHPLTNYFELV